jgi:hypothetical protein
LPTSGVVVPRIHTRSAAIAALGTLAAGFLVVAAPASTAAASILSTARVTIVDTRGRPAPWNRPVEYDPTNSTPAGGWAKTDDVSVVVDGGTANAEFSLELEAPHGIPFHTGSYYGDDPNGFPGVRGFATLAEDNQSCQGVQFTIVDLASSGTAITRLDVRFQTACGFYSSANATIIGELQLGEPAPAPKVMTAARSFAWPDVPVGTRSPAAVPVWFRNTGSGPLAVGAASLSGANIRDFSVVADTCSHKTLAGHTACSVVMAFSPRAAGIRSAVLTVPVGTGRIPISLLGTGPQGRTLLRINSQAGDYIGGGRSYLITDAQTQMQVNNGSDTTLTAFTYNDGPMWLTWLEQRGGGPLRVGIHTIDDESNNGFWSFIEGQGRGCSYMTGTVNIKQATFDADYAPSTFDATFTQTCTDTPHAHLTGEIAYRATNTATAPTGPFILHNGQSLNAGQAITNGGDANPKAYKLAVTPAGQAVLTGPTGKTLWATPTAAARARDRLTVSSKGILALVSYTGVVLWQTATAGSGTANFLALQSDGNLVLNNANYQPVWTTGTATVAG